MTKQRLLQHLQRTAGSCRAVAFDVFDTLLRRDVAAPADLFALMERTGRARPGFAAARRAAEAAARARHPGREVTLAEIYACPGLAGADPAAECAAERAVLRPDPDLLAAARACKDRGLRVYVVSDMYLPAAGIGEILRRAGFDFLDGVFVSSEYGVQKRSGRLFRTFLRQTGLRPAQVLFVGNDRRADALGAALAGIRCLLVPPPAPPAHYGPPASAEEGALYAFLQGRGPRDPAGAVGYALLGPLLLAFAAWLRDNARPGVRMVFLARDMELVRRLYDRTAGAGASGYLRVSRRSLCPALLLRPLTGGALDLLADALPRQRLTVAQVLAYLGFAPGTALPGHPAGAEIDLRTRPLSRAAGELLLAAAALAKGPAGEPVRRQARLARAYLAGEGIGRGPVCLVDIGSGGTTQRILEELTGARLQGAYLACDERLHAQLPPDRAAAFLFGGRPAPLWYWAGQPMLERLISEPCAPTTAYEPAGEGARPAVPADPAPVPGAVAAARAGALDFAADWLAGPWAGLGLPAEYAAAALLDLIRAPGRAEADALGDLTVEDGGEWPLAAPRRRADYLRDPRAFGRDLRDARWKTAFLRRALPLPLPWDKVYAALKHRQNG